VVARRRAWRVERGRRYWFIACYSHASKQEAFSTYERMARAKLPTLLFLHNYTDQWCIAVYASDEQLIKAGWSRPLETYAGLLRVRELLVEATLLRAANFGTKEIDEVIDKIMTMKDGA